METAGTQRNERLTASTGLLLLVLLAVLGITIVRIGQLIWLHLFLGLLLVGPVALKLASTGYRFARYYGGDLAYRRKGPPALTLRLLAPAVVLTTIVVFASGVILLLDGPQNRGLVFTIHKVSFIVWLVFTALHVLGHLPGLGGSLRAPAVGPPGSRPGGRWGAGSGDAGRWIALSGACVGGLVLALVLLPDFTAWTTHGVLGHHHRG
jgi:hypothetical protein